MPIPSWPTTLPQLRGQLQSAGTSSLYAAPLKTTFDDGPTRTRRRQINRPTPLMMALDLKVTTLPIFQAFVLDDLNEGARRFTGPVVLPNGAIGTRTCKIDGEVQLRWPGGVEPEVTFTLSVWGWRA